jgi:lipopolysaccharide/colanic/teichoic acid biosynthesis glycosyltransferase
MADVLRRRRWFAPRTALDHGDDSPLFGWSLEVSEVNVTRTKLSGDGHAEHARSMLRVAPGSGAGPVIKRAVDVLGASAVLLLSLPVCAVALLAIVGESGRPVLYRARRVGLRGQPLYMLKFRKMHRDARGPALTAARDPRLTRTGYVLARTRVDELPQFWHVLRGEMSLIGPRPEDPMFVAARMDDYAEILTVRPGISGLSQLAFAEERRILSGEDAVGDYLTRILPQKCTLDRLYVREATVLTDLRIAAWTVAAVVFRVPVAVDRTSGALSRRRRPCHPPSRPVSRSRALRRSPS